MRFILKTNNLSSVIERAKLFSVNKYVQIDEFKIIDEIDEVTYVVHKHLRALKKKIRLTIGIYEQNSKRTLYSRT